MRRAPTLRGLSDVREGTKAVGTIQEPYLAVAVVGIIQAATYRSVSCG